MAMSTGMNENEDIWNWRGMVPRMVDIFIQRVKVVWMYHCKMIHHNDFYMLRTRLLLDTVHPSEMSGWVENTEKLMVMCCNSLKLAAVGVMCNKTTYTSSPRFRL